MAETGFIISAEEEERLLKPIDDYVGNIQNQIDELRKDGSDKVVSLKNRIAITKEDKNLSKTEQEKIIEECKKELAKAKTIEESNKAQISKLIAEAEGYLDKHYDAEYYHIVAKSCQSAKEAEEMALWKKKSLMPRHRFT